MLQSQQSRSKIAVTKSNIEIRPLEWLPQSCETVRWFAQFFLLHFYKYTCRYHYRINLVKLWVSMMDDLVVWPGYLSQ